MARDVRCLLRQSARTPVRAGVSRSAVAQPSPGPVQPPASAPAPAPGLVAVRETLTPATREAPDDGRSQRFLEVRGVGGGARADQGRGVALPVRFGVRARVV